MIPHFTGKETEAQTRENTSFLKLTQRTGGENNSHTGNGNSQFLLFPAQHTASMYDQFKGQNPSPARSMDRVQRKDLKNEDV